MAGHHRRSPLPPKYQPDEISLANLERISQAFEDLDTLGASTPRGGIQTGTDPGTHTSEIPCVPRTTP